MKKFLAIILVLVLFFSVSLIFIRVSHQKRSVLAQTCQNDDGVCPEGCNVKNDLDCLRIEIGEEEYVFGPTGTFIDNPFLSVPVSTGIRGFSASGDTYLFSGPDLKHLERNTNPVLGRGKAEEFDGCGRWLNSVYKLTENHWLGWYHAEGPGGVCRKSVAFTESFDGGRSWSVPNYPNNQVLTGYEGYDEGDQKVIKIGDYFYMFFLASRDWKIHLARSPVSQEGRPGTWKKYYQGSFSEPGLGGRSTLIDEDLLDRPVVYNSYLDRYIAGMASGHFGLQISFSDGTDFLAWKRFPKWAYPPVSYTGDPRVDVWVNNGWRENSQNLMQLYAYSSFIGLDGNSDSVGQEFYLYYMKLFPGQGFDQRYQMRRKIKLYENMEDPHLAKVALARYEKQTPKKTKVSTEIAKPSEGYQKIKTLGYLLSYEKEGFKALYECYIPIWDDYMVSLSDPASRNWEHCENEGDNFVRRIGWISETQIEEVNLPVYRCFNEDDKDHFLSIYPNCEGKRTEFLVGYLFKGNLIDNPGFESGHEGWTFSSGNAGEDGSGEVTEEESKTETHSYKITLSADGVWSAVLTTSIGPVRKGETFTLSGWIKTEGEIAATLKAQPNHQPWTSHGESDVSHTDGWQFVSKAFSIQDDYDGFEVVIAGGSSRGIVYFDDIKLIRGCPCWDGDGMCPEGCDPSDDSDCGDLDGDGDRDTADVRELLSRYGSNDSDADLSRDGLVNGIDFGLMLKLIL